MNQDDENEVNISMPEKRAYDQMQNADITANNQPPTKRRKFNLLKQLYLLMMNALNDLES